MKSLHQCLQLVLVLELLAGVAFAADPATQPPQPAPITQPPPMPQSPPVAPAAEASDGQWVSTQQYGWIWIPYAQVDTYISPAGSPYEYVYYPSVGWNWVYAPWVFAWGPTPYWGAYGRVHFRLVFASVVFAARVFGTSRRKLCSTRISRRVYWTR